ncbi:hypothetical protein KC343_g135 [Hortaea werneckii]|nr:hypothetical protein KC352_g1245 [Hortaea werneckii]KAI7573132.1 hypothetical protein KC317_g155 [Hortaea werneckii]KAI7628522.1 hypothetical protein KC346_g131 [Hortaea werneckii]KAI7638357.1 hypothetical protein KC343_g135 [Hortaea werneckii]KAI7683989.1 hypothetical protein KC319_g162 [Hortaea werneckii]
MAEDQKQMQDVVIKDEALDLARDHVPAGEPALKLDPDIVMTEAPPTPNSKLQKTAARFEELEGALKDEKNYSSEAMQKLVLEARDLFRKSQDTLMDFRELLRDTFTSYRPPGLWETLDIQRAVMDSMEDKIVSMTSPPKSYEWEAEYH